MWAALSIALAITTLELLGGFLSQSLALVSDSGHVLTDVLSIGVSILTIRMGRKPHTSRRTFGYHRAEIFAALVNGSTLFLIALLIVYEAYRRLLQPSQVQGPLLVAVAVIGLAGNLLMARLLSKGRETSLNLRGAFLHVVGDTLSSVGVIIGGLVVTFTSYTFVDPLVAILIGVLILRNAYGLVRESSDILMEATPRHLDLDAVSESIRSIDGVVEVHDLHIWTITSGLYALSGHISVHADTVEEGPRIVSRVSELLRSKYGIEHVTLQLEKEPLEKIQGPAKPDEPV